MGDSTLAFSHLFKVSVDTAQRSESPLRASSRSRAVSGFVLFTHTGEIPEIIGALFGNVSNYGFFNTLRRERTHVWPLARLLELLA